MGELSLNGFEMSGTTTNRPDNVEEGQPYFNETLGVWQVRNAATPAAWQGAYIATKWSMAAMGLWGIDVDGAGTNGGGIVGDAGSTSATYNKVYDHGTTAFASLIDSSSLASWTANAQLFPDAGSEQINDAFYIGQAVPFCECTIEDVGGGTFATWSDDGGLWEYWNGTAWVTLPIVIDNSDATAQDGMRPGQRSGAISFVPPSAWAAVSVDSQEAYWVRWRFTAAVLTQTATIMALGVVTPVDGFTCPHGSKVTGIRANDGATTLHTTANVEFILMNFTTGLHSGVAGAANVWAQDKRQGSWSTAGAGAAAMTGVACSTGDVLGVLNTAEDGTNEPTNVMLELNVSAP